MNEIPPRKHGVAAAHGDPGKAPPTDRFFRANRTTFCGYIYDDSDVARKFVVEFLVDGLPVSATLSDEPVDALVAAGIGDGRFGFTFTLPEESVSNSRLVEARLANLGVAIGEPIACDELSAHAPPLRRCELIWVGGLRFEGWLDSGEEGPIEILVAQQPVMRVSVTGWTHVHMGDGYGVARRLDFHLPDSFADGRVRLLSAKDADGHDLLPAPIAFVAFDNGLAQALDQMGRWESERLRGELFDRLLPASMPFHAYQSWKERFTPPARATALQAAVMLIGHDRIEESIDSLESQGDIAWTAVSLPTRGVLSGFDRKLATDFLGGDAGSSDFVVFGLSGTIFSPGALCRIAEVFEAEADCVCVYGDIEVQADGGAVWPIAFSALDRERVLEQGYGALLFAVRKSLAIDALQSTASLYELFNLCCVQGGWQSVRHLPGAVAAVPRIDIKRAAQELKQAAELCLRQEGSDAEVDVRSTTVLPGVRIRRKIGRRHSTTIIIPTRNRVELLQRCIDSIRPALGRAHAKVLIVDNDSTDPAALEFLSTVQSRDIAVLRSAGPFNFARLNNVAVRHCDADNICLLNNDIQALDDDWLSEMLSRLEDAGVGAVGAKLVWPSGLVQHGGVALGANFMAAHAFNERMDGDPGYGGLLEVAHECSAVTAACLLMRRQDYLAVEGMDEIRFPVIFNDVDLCLKLRHRGQRIVFSPDAKLIHLESASRGSDEAPERKARFQHELLMLRAKWGQVLLDDPYYSPILGLDAEPFSALAWPPRSWQSRLNAMPSPNCPPPGA